MKARSAKNKGSRLERQVAGEYRRIGIEARRMPLSGAIPHLKADIYKPVHDGWHDECKNQETVKLKEWWHQASSTCGKSEPVLHISANYRPIITAIRSDKYYDMLLELDQSDQRFMHKQKKVTTKRLNLWNEWDDIWNRDEIGEPVLHLENLELTIISLEHYMELRDCLNAVR